MGERNGTKFTVQQRHEMRARAWQLHQGGMSQQLIADELDVSQGTISYWLREWAARNKEPSPFEVAAAKIREELVCCDIFERLDRLPFRGEHWQRIRASSEFHPKCFHGEWAARIVDKLGRK